ncbi:hypothetical protein N7491_003681 [Penicillium cf. griseofulvum]|uniref:Uncharacterized protein n=1 Tax=Penicillium cf. griseofulvum TaxID=2972120 RepID=A0A9W9MQN6_9EURO|nr:hypothetical protein N7472_002140 [Penicillium cf. griseofulvum]KAJ5441275.1 hypothetical protein N7491_003681 [Penicillium cf. griseofulvum]KAJ5449326.1 hypothetical protein N7445_004147 [Penicillium cf. griseofulvum]
MCICSEASLTRSDSDLQRPRLATTPNTTTTTYRPVFHEGRGLLGQRERPRGSNSRELGPLRGAVD